MAAPAPPTNPAAAFPNGDPRNALYASNLAALEHQYNTTLAIDQESLKNYRANSEYSQRLIGNQEPLGYQANQNKANTEGLLNSGINASRRGTLAANYANRRFAITKGLQQNEGRIKAAEQRAKEGLDIGKSNLATKTLAEGYKELLAEPQTTPEPAATGYTPPGVIPQPGVSYPNLPAEGAKYRVGPAGSGRPIQWSRDPKVRAEQAKRGW